MKKIMNGMNILNVMAYFIVRGPRIPTGQAKPKPMLSCMPARRSRADAGHHLNPFSSSPKPKTSRTCVCSVRHDLKSRTYQRKYKSSFTPVSSRPKIKTSKTCVSSARYIMQSRGIKIKQIRDSLSVQDCMGFGLSPQRVCAGHGVWGG